MTVAGWQLKIGRRNKGSVKAYPRRTLNGFERANLPVSQLVLDGSFKRSLLVKVKPLTDDFRW